MANIITFKVQKEFALIPTLEPTYKDKEKAVKAGYEELLRVEQYLTNEDYYYARPTQHGCNIYNKDKTSPTGRTLAGACSTYEVIDYVAQRLNKNSHIVSPTEKVDY